MPRATSIARTRSASPRSSRKRACGPILGLSGRGDVTAMLERYFPALVARNVEGLRWKKLFARELALATGGTPGPAPGCPGCEDFGLCSPPVR